MDTLALPMLLAINLALVLAPTLAIWRTLSRRPSGPTAWPYIVLALVGPILAGSVLLVVLWLPQYSGQCGGWLGETSPCSGFGQYATETMFWAAMSLAVPGLLGMLLGVVVLVVLLISRRLSRPAA